ncbi:integration host factor subunit beta [Lamprobacter modestohalophilus]|uniref:integration host factor subunit beta n=1 Tax=Lamprobacter modestohalophilus TaxID=1064514 RepID=UPI002ADECD98|nr:integration host factor subunit beta [Lamprobacter modestohalophilus]MEA1053138.1 integration host factor subunit beta [Lamprobacter modestohalophilus]MEA1053495.1 integration host factor subunit beta [Lamprobacter modestohalophilus]
MIRSEFITVLALHQRHLAPEDIDLAVKALINLLRETLAAGERIEVRGFGSFELRRYEPRVARNPKTGESVTLPARYRVHFKPGKELRERVDAGMADNAYNGAAND